MCCQDQQQSGAAMEGEHACGGHGGWKTHKKWLVIAGTIALLAFALAQVFRAIETGKSLPLIGKTASSRLITITGQGKVKGIPDIASVNLGYTVERKDVRSAQTENANKMNAVMDSLKKLGIAADDIQTSDYSIYPQYDYKDGRQSLRGYSVTQSLAVKIRDLAKISAVLDAAGSIGLNQVGGIQFTMDDPEKLRQDARVKALEQAKAKAATLTEVMGVKLGRVVSFSEDAGGMPPPVPMYMKAMEVGMGGAAPDIAPGSLDVIVNAVVQYEIE